MYKFSPARLTGKQHCSRSNNRVTNHIEFLPFNAKHYTMLCIVVSFDMYYSNNKKQKNEKDNF